MRGQTDRDGPPMQMFSTCRGENKLRQDEANEVTEEKNLL